jgi:hypothetical protein
MFSNTGPLAAMGIYTGTGSGGGGGILTKSALPWTSTKKTSPITMVATEFTCLHAPPEVLAVGPS